MSMASGCGMFWMAVTIEPYDDERRAALPCYILRVPVLPDGRLAFRSLRDAPERARVWRCEQDGARQPGRLQLVDFQWICTWEGPGEQVDMRLVGASFGPDDVIGVRPGNGPLTVYRVSERAGLWSRPDDCH